MSKKLHKPILKPGSAYKINGKLWIEYKGEKFFGPGPAQLLENIKKTGSLNKAATEMHMSYKKSWEIINAINTLVSAPLVITKSGGEKGGGSIVTEDAEKLIEYHRQLRKRFTAFLEKETQALISLL